jgi:hypothetical protein
MFETCFSTLRRVIAQLLTDRLIGAAFGDQLEHLTLARSERLQWAVVGRAGSEEARHDQRIQRRAAADDVP